PLVVNTISQGEVIVLLAPDGDVLVKAADLAGRRLFDGEGPIVTVEGESWVSLRSLSPGIEFALDPEELTLTLTVDASYFGTGTLSLANPRPAGMRYARSPSLFANYAVSLSDDEEVSLVTESGATLLGGLLYGSATVTDAGLTRGLSYFHYDSPERLRRLSIGDVIVRGDSLAGSGTLAGVRIGREFGLDPYFFRLPGPDFRASVSTPSRVEVYANGRLVRTEQLPPGMFELRDLQVQAGRGDAQVVITDAFGRRTVLEQSYYLPTSMLARGISDYELAFGVEREGPDRYGEPTAVARYRIGLSDRWTVGTHGEAQQDLLNAGLDLSTAFGRGEVRLGFAASRTDEENGAAASFLYSYLSAGGFGLNVHGRYFSPVYENIAISAGEEGLRGEISTGFGKRLGPIVLSADYRRLDFRTEEDQESLGILATTRLSSRGQLLASARWSDSGPGGRRGEYFAGISLSLGGGITVNVGAENRPERNAIRADVQRSHVAAKGVTFRLSSDLTEEEAAGSGYVEYSGDYGTYGVEYIRSEEGTSTATLRTAGGIVWIGGRLYASRPVDQSFALVRIPEVPGVRVYANNFQIGRTDGRGDLLLPDLFAYHANRISFEDKDVPMDYRIGDLAEVIAPPFRGGALVEFPVAPVRNVVGTIRMRRGAGALEVPAYGTAILAPEGARSPIGVDGEFYFENVSSGEHELEVVWRGDRCTVRFEVPENGGMLREAGALECTLAEGSDSP
ncbi:MAG TPA: fimbria/pilus outer membrane usher protein, partial [Thermoanaerobaculia bacterium]|nr:fimbria/pilus outer membrane usher protein [Thermoanaerobaculia bacterium]